MQQDLDSERFKPAHAAKQQQVDKQPLIRVVVRGDVGLGVQQYVENDGDGEGADGCCHYAVVARQQQRQIAARHTSH